MLLSFRRNRRSQTTSSMASSPQPASLRSQRCHAHPLLGAPTLLQRGPGLLWLQPSWQPR
uniref:Centrosomal protein 89 n=1 Tax=Mus musculus TaxID=10090 RepID=A0A0U1RNE9_MOUSE